MIIMFTKVKSHGFYLVSVTPKETGDTIVENHCSGSSQYNIVLSLFEINHFFITYFIVLPHGKAINIWHTTLFHWQRKQISRM
jgi:hypothetical protein